MQIKSFYPRLKKQLGFTMIELLIVIAILGILAVAVLSAINPIEQINRGRDTGTRSDAEQLVTAIDRYYAMKGIYPWMDAASDPVAYPWTMVGLTDNLGAPTFLSTGGCPTLYRLSDMPATPPAECGTEVGTQELKIGFVNKVDADTYNKLYVFHDDQNYDSTYVCFEPKSNSFQQEADDRITAGVPDDYPADAYDQPADGHCGPGGNCICLP
jgi:prepilin-type N-terminal cleavage/methylation domain-containing protein